MVVRYGDMQESATEKNTDIKGLGKVSAHYEMDEYLFQRVVHLPMKHFSNKRSLNEQWHQLHLTV